MDFIDLFAGIGGFRIGLERVGFTHVSSVEKDKFCRRSYEQIFGEPPEHGDVYGVGEGELPEADIITAGFPCQAFSAIGEKRGFVDERGDVFFEAVRIIRDVRPSFVLLENVEGILSHDGGTTYRRVKDELGKLGYITERATLDSRDFGLPQRRRRVFIVGYTDPECIGKVLPFKGEKENPSKTNERGGSKNFNCIDASIHKGVDKHAQRSVVIENKAVFPHQYPKDYPRTRPFPCPECEDTIFAHCDCLGVSSTFEDAKARMPTPLECWRLQGFPDRAFESAKQVNSDTQLYKQAGNAVSVPVVESIGKRLKNVQN